MIKRRISGRIDYVHRQHGVTGREWWTLAVADDDTRTLTANCEMQDDAVQRDVVYSVDHDFRPQEAFVRLAVAGVLQGSAWFRFTDECAQAEGHNQVQGRFSQTLSTARRARVFAPHPVQSDAWQTAAYDHALGNARQHIAPCFNPSPLANGGSGPLLTQTDKHLEYVGEEEVAVPAGVFACQHYRVYPKDFEDPLELWVFGPDRILALCSWRLLDSRYELAEYSPQGRGQD